MVVKPLCGQCHSRICEHASTEPTAFRREDGRVIYLNRYGKRFLTPRSAQLLLLLSKGLSNREIAEATGITVGTVKVYLSRVWFAIGVSTRLEAALWARNHIDILKDIAA